MRRTAWTITLLSLLITLTSGILCSCGESTTKLKSPDEADLSQVKPGELLQLPFSNDLRLLQYSGMQYRGRLPRYGEKKGRKLWYAVKYDVYEHKNDTESLVFSRAPVSIDDYGGGSDAGSGGSPVEIDIIFHHTEDRGFEGTLRTIIGESGSTGSQDFYFLSGEYSGWSVEAKDRAEIRIGEPIPLGSFFFKERRESDEDRVTTEVRWFLYLKLVDSQG